MPLYSKLISKLAFSDGFSNARKFGHVWFLFFKIVLENTKNTIFVFFENYACFFFKFSVFCVFQIKKKESNPLCVFLIPFVF